ncbi:hypothetical protein AtNW77_Chr4g0299031 [Arabidopsis thaliana]|uniref:At4g22400 n=2 Tax=Arabidopsis TaxID=3701 RepID=Q9SUX9_ARATH|nr:uncharacterized protein AT4G22400 [Arabidopsis thaliana]KAG7616928.1 hypothetical protein ISN45_At04g023540 [Arabidopsis thaliana x Arabidopsis arenosa]AAS65943.1 At4g22400 [Arabidopsis thaliana]AAT47811.1 At4g22400 [Arabidopsis thaliana]AEE84604.1 hypothetical protein AT4G22400 [Arabidopsis thaliana]CAB52814.1 putative protein [Arabidopsis thaliana]|eukprot:NP_193971.1 hypothetical protein AT4G22400 [Arabidopsis thaliana]
MLSSHLSQICFSCRDPLGNLPADLIRKCTDLMDLNFAEGQRLRTLNKNWKLALPSFRKGAYREERPWLLYRERGSGETRFFDPVRERVHRGNDPRLADARFLGSTLGWLVMSESLDLNPRKTHQTFLYNPFISELQQLPELTLDSPYPTGVLRYGVLTGNPSDNNTYACLITDYLHEIGNRRDTYTLLIYYVAKTSGRWEQNWSVASMLVVGIFDTWYIESISPSPDKISIEIWPKRYDFTFQTQEWNVSNFIPVDPIQWDPFHDQSLYHVKHRLQLPENPSTLAIIIGTSTDRTRVRNKIIGDQSDDDDPRASDHIIDGVWVEVRP